VTRPAAPFTRLRRSRGCAVHAAAPVIWVHQSSGGAGHPAAPAAPVTRQHVAADTDD
jgi:hypothetical protein